MFGLCYKGTLFAFNSVACGHVFAEITTFKYCGNERKQVILQQKKGRQENRRLPLYEIDIIMFLYNSILGPP